MLTSMRRVTPKIRYVMTVAQTESIGWYTRQQVLGRQGIGLHAAAILYMYADI